MWKRLVSVVVCASLFVCIMFGYNFVSAQTQDDYYLQEVNAIKAQEAHPDRNVVLIVIGRGLDEKSNINRWQNPLEICDNNIDDDNNGRIDDCFGYDFVGNSNNVSEFGDFHSSTFLTELAVGKGIDGGLRGVASGAPVLPLKINNGSDGDFIVITRLIETAYYVADLSKKLQFSGTRFVVLVDVITPFTYPEFRAAFKALDLQGIPVVAPVGSQNIRISDFSLARYPASFALDNIVAVTGVDRDRKKLTNANTGPGIIHISAPASIHYQGEDFEGTGIAAALVAGGLVLVYDNFEINHVTAIARIFDSAKALPDEGIGGMLDVFGALKSTAQANLHPILDIAHEDKGTVNVPFVIDTGKSLDPENAQLKFLVIIDDGETFSSPKEYIGSKIRLVFEKAAFYAVIIKASDDFQDSEYQLFYLQVFPFKNRPPVAQVEPIFDAVRFNEVLTFDMSKSFDPEGKKLKFSYTSTDHKDIGLLKTKNPLISINLKEHFQEIKLGSYQFAFVAVERRGLKQASLAAFAIRFVTDVITVKSAIYDEQTRQFEIVATSSHQNDKSLPTPVGIQVVRYGPMKFDVSRDAFVFRSTPMNRPSEPITLTSTYYDEVVVNF